MEETTGTAGGSGGVGTDFGAEEPQWRVSVSRSAPAEDEEKISEPDSGVSVESELTDAMQEFDTVQQSRKEMDGTVQNIISGAEAASVPVLGECLPSEVPADYEIVFARYTITDRNDHNLTLQYSNGDSAFWINLTQTAYAADESFCEEMSICSVEENWQDDIPEPGEDGSIQVALLLKNSVLAEYSGFLAGDEIIELFESIQ